MKMMYRAVRVLGALQSRHVTGGSPAALQSSCARHENYPRWVVMLIDCCKNNEELASCGTSLKLCAAVVKCVSKAYMMQVHEGTAALAPT